MSGRNLAFKRNASQVSIHKDCFQNECKAKNAVDGITNEWFWNKCSLSSDEENPWWNVDLGIEAIIHNLHIVGFKDVKQTYQIEIKSSTGINNFHRVVTAAANVDTNINVIGRVVNLTREVKGRLHICEVYVYDDCQENMCGYDCKKPCHCRDATIWDKLSGNCSNGCTDEWEGSQCNIQAEETFDCASGRYGRNCMNRCNKNCKGDQRRFCSTTDGSCFGGCNDGWKGNLCDEACYEGYYGQNCSTKCSDYCHGGKGYCNKIDGNCKFGCMIGWTAPLCDQACSSGMYGHRCAYKCSQQCDKQECNNTDGRCTRGCIPGWTGEKCRKPCSSGMYGHRCAYKCSQQCDKQECNNTDGWCTRGCIPGWTGEKCRKRVYSFNLKYIIASV
ncbi:multiple epidermal growth factor-like domains protein 10 [Ruditapes philippinarum]|uniref:multiple epidermal growth factor-like domains protein 10 n=1 Tax=Ruditapes philippinarum TaxID=129788 RepID=UPI00295AEBF6|nr:multiple epidermal growth factor-like domains protein 10 [Ruditapes philippinarum]